MKMLRLAHTDALMRGKMAGKAFDSYAVLVSVNGNEGLLASENVNGDTYFDIASCGKILHTTPLVLQAIGEGRFTLDSTLPEFFENVPEEKRAITMRQLLTHSSGIVRFLLPKDVGAWPIDAIADCMIRYPLAFAPGTNYQYSCNGMILLGFILEKLYGKTLEALFEERLKKPLGMTRSRFEIALDEPNAAVCYRWNDGRPKRFDDENVTLLGRVCGSGGSFFTLNDIEKYVRAVFAKSPLLYPEKFFALAETDYTPNFTEGRGLGYLIVDKRYPQTGNLFPEGSFGHCGHTGQSIFMNREKNMHVVILTNATRFAAMKNDFKRYDYGEVCAMRAEIHNEILRDLREEALL